MHCSPGMKPIISVRRATEDDILRMQRVDRECFGFANRTETYRHAIKAAIIFVVLSNKRVVGAAVMLPTERENALEIYTFGVLKQVRGLGHARELMKACIDHAADQMYYRLLLSVNENNGRAIAFYQKFGFKFVNQSGQLMLLDVWNMPRLNPLDEHRQDEMLEALKHHRRWDGIRPIRFIDLTRAYFFFAVCGVDGLAGEWEYEEQANDENH